MIPIVVPACKEDIDSIHLLLTPFADEQLLLPRPVEDIRNNLHNFLVAKSDGKNIGCVAVRDYGNNLYEIRSLAVHNDFGGRGIGSQLIQTAIASRKQESKNCRFFALTRRPNLFKRLGFKLVSKEIFPEKIWSDCSKCPKKDQCDEDALILEN